MDKEIQKTFVTGDKWLYYKIYTGSKTADRILVEHIKPITEMLVEKRLIDKWFFIRYADPKQHLRIRFYCSEIKNVAKVIETLQALFAELMEQELIWNVMTDTYKREIQRYGSNTIELSENIFFFNSVLIVSSLEVFADDEETRWIFALKEIDNLLTNFEYTIDLKFQLLEILKTSMGNEFGMNKDLSKQLDLKYRNFRSRIEDFLNPESSNDQQFMELEYHLDCFNKNMKEPAALILDYKKSNKLETQFNSLLISYIHMSMVRIFKSKNRMHEMVVYDFLFKYYKSQRARIMNEQKNRTVISSF